MKKFNNNKQYTDEGRTYIIMKGKEYPLLYHMNPKLFNFAKELTPNEIEGLISAYKGRIKGKDNDTIKKLRTDIKLLEDIRRILKRNPNMYKETELDLEQNIILSNKLLRYLGYTLQTLYYDEVEHIFNILQTERLILEKCSLYNEEVIATALVSEILDYYKSSYKLNDIIDFYQIEEPEYLDFKIILNKWLKSNYWYKY